MGDVHGDNTLALGDDGQEQPKKSVSTMLVEIALELYEFGVDDAGDTYATPKNGTRVTYLVRGGKLSLRKQLAREFFRRHAKAAPAQALADAVLVVEGFAQERDEEQLHLRVARAGRAHWLDLGDHTGRAVRITETGWAVESSAPVLFKRTELTGALPAPELGGDLAELWQWLNVEEGDRPLVLAWLLAALIPDVPHPVLALFGEQGTGKTTAQKILVSLLDPGPVPVRKAPRDADSWVTAAAGSWVVGLDNLSDVPAWLSDSICRAVTGDGDVRRKLYTNGELAVFAYRRAIILNGIDLGAIRGNLADRMMPVNLHRIPDDARREEHDMWTAWQEAHPRILGALLSGAAGVAGVLPSVHLEFKPRMADFARVLAAVDRLHGTDGLVRYIAKQRSMATDSLQADEFITRVRELGGFEGTAAELLKRVTPDDERWKPPRDWPSNARAVTQRLRRQAPVMRKDGWTVEDDDGANHDKVIRWTITSPAGNTGDTRHQELGRDRDPPDPQTRVRCSVCGSAGLAGMVRYPTLHASHSPHCTACGEPLDPVHADTGTHPTCDPKENRR